MAGEFRANIINSSGNWWDSSSSRNSSDLHHHQLDSGSSSSSTSTTSLGSFGWPNNSTNDNINKSATRSSSCMADSIPVISTDPPPPAVFHQEIPKPQQDRSADSNLQMMRLGLCSSPALDWNQDSLIRGGKLDHDYHQSMMEEDNLGLGSNPTNFIQQQHVDVQWRGKVFLPAMQGEDQVGFSVEHHQPQYSSSADDNNTHPVTCHGLSCDFPVDNSSVNYGGQHPSNILVPHEGLFGSNNNNQPFFENPFVPNTCGLLLPSTNNNNNNSLPNKFAQFLRNSSSKVLPSSNNPHFQYSHNNASSVVGVPSAGVSSGFFSPLRTPPVPARSTFDDKSKQNTKAKDSTAQSITKTKSGSEASTKRSRSETQSTLPPFKVRKEKMGDRVTALQQLVSPFGKTDTASVLTEAIEYIKFLHEQVSVLSTPYMKNAALMHHHQNYDKAREHGAGPNKDLRSRGLCLVPVSSTFPVTHETTVDFWTPTFGGSFR